ncbi:hypothetical protein G5B35_18300 [Parapusillimonas sp. SGNA-6]|uniref:hypothetical protein n=1 Tax=Parapedobacter sp. SGR-10 TaxID=2710879 RepID=UPI0013D8CD58|nr:hypothetical protein [Parapedobacter sp. SGR-10]NGF55279.1 hypothetical protein [Parapedobacter sp. SGR-10]NGM89249.1 hypothetical protein [Parapusillimonas sp. SGNA-6]
MENRAEKIQDYIDGLLLGEELIQFEKQIAEDEDLKVEVSLQQELQGIIRSRLNSNEKILRTHMQNARILSQSTKGSSKKVYKLYLPIAAVACLLVFFSLFLLRNSDSGLYDLPTMQSEIVRGQEENVSYEHAVKAFNNKEYEQARTMLDILITADSTIVQYQYYAALTYFGEENWAQSIQELTPLAEGKSIFADEAKYYLAVAYHKTEQKDKAIALLNEIPAQGKVGQKASKLLKELK